MSPKNTIQDYYGGKYLQPICFIKQESTSSTYLNFDNYWADNYQRFSDIIYKVQHSTTHIKLSDQSKYQCDAEVVITRDGLIGIKIPDDVNDDEDNLNVISEHINSFLAYLSMGGIHFSPIQYNQIERLKHDDGKLLLEQTVSNFKNYDDRTRIELRDKNIVTESSYYQSILNNNNFYNIKEFINAYQNGLIIGQEFFHGRESLFLKAYESYKNSKYETSLLLGWALIEIIINKYWETEFISKTTKDECSRKNRLKDHRTYTSSIKIEILYVNNAINLDLYNNLNILRKTRNNLIHSGKTPNRINSGYVLVAIKKLVQSFTDIEMKFNNPGCTYYGSWTVNN